ncbi:MAG: SDR family NAD(P)-dependent oxidoreductase [Bacteroidaceae bacterium]|nr:SDR family NAD(P)-dependent oxidoreductase [Bacteroidaceae bacterium]
MEGTARNKVIVITGASGSIGACTVKAMAAEGWRVIMACRNVEKGEAVRQEILSTLPNALIEVRQVEMSSLASVRQFAAGLQGITVDALFNNAGVISNGYSTTVDGYENTIAVNYLAPAVLTNLLLPQIPKGGRILNMVSLMVRFGRLTPDWQNWGEQHFSRLLSYSDSKQALLLYTIALARRNPYIYINVCDPGIVNSNMIHMDRWYDTIADLFFRPIIKTPEQGAAPAIRALHADDTMKYFVGRKTSDIPARYLNSPLIEPLWNHITAFSDKVGSINGSEV